MDKSELINTQLIKIRQLEDKIDELSKQLQPLQEANKGLSEVKYSQ